MERERAGVPARCAEGRVTPAPSLLLRSAMAEAKTVQRSGWQRKAIEGLPRWAAASGARRCRRAAVLALTAGVSQPATPKPRGVTGAQRKGGGRKNQHEPSGT